MFFSLLYIVSIFFTFSLKSNIILNYVKSKIYLLFFRLEIYIFYSYQINHIIQNSKDFLKNIIV